MTTTISGTTGITTNSLTATGNPAVTFSNSATLGAGNATGFKNRIINGGMTIDQRNAGASQTFTAAGALAYSVDRWYGFCTGANVTGQQVAGSTTPSVTQFRYRFTGAASVATVGFGQRIEQKNSYDLAGSTCTLSADLAISATLTTVTWTASYATTTADTFGTLASPTVTQIATGTFTVTSTVTNFSTNISVPAAATTGIQIVFTIGALTAGLTWTIGNVQLEAGSSATSFDARDYGRELILCQRYFVKTYGQSVAVPTNSSSGFVRTRSYSGAYGAFVWLLPVSMRTAPTASIYNYSTSAVNSWWNTDASNSVAAAVSTTGEQNITVESSALTANQTYTFHLTGYAEL